MIGEEPSDNLLQPLSLLRDWPMSSPSQLVLDLRDLCAHAVPSHFPFDQKAALAGYAADERKAEKIEGFRFADAPLGAQFCSGVWSWGLSRQSQ